MASRRAADRGSGQPTEAALRRALERSAADDGASSVEAARCMHELARLLTTGVSLDDDRAISSGPAVASSRRDRLAEAHSLFERSLEIKQRVLAASDPEVAVTMHDWALLCEATGQSERAGALWAAAEAALAEPSAGTENDNNQRGEPS